MAEILYNAHNLIIDLKKYMIIMTYTAISIKVVGSDSSLRDKTEG